jgi:hypothetical protein
MQEQIENIVDKYLGMQPKDVGCKNWYIMRLNMIEEIKQLKLYSVSNCALDDTVEYRGKHYFFKEYNNGEVLIASAKSVRNKDYNDWWVDAKEVHCC